MSYSINDKDNRARAPLAGAYAPSESYVEGPGWNPFDDPYAEDIENGSGPRGSFNASMGYGQYRGRMGADTSNLPPSQRGLYENSAPSLEAIQGAYDANLKNGMTHQEIMKLFNDQADRDAKFWSDGFAKDPNFSQTLYNNSQAMMGNKYGTTEASGIAYAQKLKNQQKNKSLLAASRGAFNHNQPPKVGSWSPGGTVTAPLAKKTRRISANTALGISPGGGNSRRTGRIGGRYGL